MHPNGASCDAVEGIAPYRYVAAVMIWLNGSFGVGKTSTAQVVAATSTRWRPFDPESVGSMLKSNLTGRSLGGDFQHFAAWRRLVPLVAREVADFTGEELVAVQTVLIEQYWNDLRAGLTRQGFDVFHVLLDADPSALRSRIEADTSATGGLARQWRLDHIAAFESNRSWMATSADLVVDTAAESPRGVARAVLAAVS